MGAGDYNTRIQVQAATQSVGNNGEVVKSWTTVFSRWAELIDTGGGEAVGADGVQASATVQLRMRYETRITPAHRIVARGRVFDVNSVEDREGRRRQMILTCSEAK